MQAADIFSGLESLDDFLTQATTDTGVYYIPFDLPNCIYFLFILLH